MTRLGRTSSLVGAVVLGLVASTAGAADPLRELTGAATRVVWVQDHSRGANDTQARGRELMLAGYDSEDGRGVRTILSRKGNFARPLLTPDGRQVIYTDRTRRRAFVVDFDGGKPRMLSAGMALACWLDPADGKTWVYTAVRLGPVTGYFYRDLRRVRLDDPSVSERIWSRTRVSPDNFQLSRDGRWAGGVFPWPNAGIVRLEDPSSLTMIGRGCWASLAPDNSRLSWVLDGAHRKLSLVAPDGGRRWTVDVTTAPEIARGEIFHPRWTNHARYLVLTGPYTKQGPVNVISGGGRQVEVFLGRFNRSFDKVERWARVSRDGLPDFFPDAWVAGGSSSRVPSDVVSRTAPAAADAAATAWPGPTRGLAWAWSNTRRPVTLPALGDRPLRTCRVLAAGRARPGRHFDMRLARGHYVAQPPDPGLADAWRNRRSLAIEVLVTPSSSQREPGTILAFGPAKGDVWLSLDEHERHLQLELATPAGGIRRRLSAIEPDRPQHLVISLADGHADVYLDGRPVAHLDDVPLPMKIGGGGRLVFGNRPAGDRDWTGRLEAVALFDHALDAAEIRARFERIRPRLTRRKPVVRAVIHARCVETSPVPSALAISPYRRALVFHHYRVDRVESGSLAHREILVAHWGLLDGRRQPGGRRTVGRPVKLVIESLDDHPELDSERQVIAIDHVELPQFYDVAD